MISERDDSGEPAPTRRRRWTIAEKIRIVRQTFQPGMPIGRVARIHGVAHRLLRRWRRLFRQGALLRDAAELRCATCGAPLAESARADAKFCSPKCRQKAYRAR